MNVSFQLQILREDQALFAIGALVEALVAIDMRQLSSQKIDNLYHAHIRYVDDQGKRWMDVAEVLKEGEGNCQSLSAWRIAELRLQGEEAKVHVKIARNPTRFHVVVRRGAGQLEDPSLLVGKAKTAKISPLDQSVRRLILLKGQRP